MDKNELQSCARAGIDNCPADSLVDLKDVTIDMRRPLHNRMEQYLEQVHNPYLFRVDKLIVKATFSGKQDLSSVLADLMARG